METLRFDLGAGSWWLYLLLCFIAVSFSVYAYRVTVPPVGNRLKAVFIGLRSIGLILLLFTMFEPLLRLRQSSTIKPRIGVLLDVSKSMQLKDRTIRRDTLTKRILENVVSALGDAADIFLVDDKVRRLSNQQYDSIRFTGYRTDLGAGIRTVANAREFDRFGAVVLITDGNHNTGEQPVYTAERSGLGIYAVGIGDTISPTDVRVSSVNASGIALVQQPMSVSIDVEQLGRSEGVPSLVLRDNGAVVARQQLTPGLSSQRAVFTWTPASEGVHKLTAEVTSSGKEYTTRNNIAQTFVRVQKNKRKILLVAGAPSPDVTFVKSAIESDPNVELVTRIQKAAGTWYEGQVDTKVFSDVKAIVLIGYPTTLSTKSIIDLIAERSKQTSLMFIPSFDVDYSKLGSLADALPFALKSNRAQEILVNPDVSEKSVSDPIMRIRGDNQDAAVWNQLPPVYRTEMFVEPKPDATVLAELKIGSAAIGEPLILKAERGEVRSVAVLGYGLYRWKLMGQGQSAARGQETQDLLTSFVGNTVQYLSVREDEKRVQIRSTFDVYSSGENVTFSATVQDQTLSAVNDAEVTIDVVGGAQKRSVICSNIGNGQYTGNIGPLPPGDYEFKGVASSRGSSLGSDYGRFVVTDVSVEETALTMNSSLLRLLAERSGGSYAPAPDIEDLITKLKDDPRLQPIVRTADREHALYHTPWFVALSLLSFSLEWFLRKRKGLV